MKPSCTVNRGKHKTLWWCILSWTLTYCLLLYFKTVQRMQSNIKRNPGWLSWCEDTSLEGVKKQKKTCGHGRKESFSQVSFSVWLLSYFIPLKWSQLLSVPPHHAITTRSETRKKEEKRKKTRWRDGKQVSKGGIKDKTVEWNQPCFLSRKLNAAQSPGKEMLAFYGSANQGYGKMSKFSRLETGGAVDGLINRTFPLHTGVKFPCQARAMFDLS